MSRQLEYNLYINGDATDKATFLTNLETAASAQGFTRYGNTFSKTVPYATAHSTWFNEFNDLVAGVYITGLYVSCSSVFDNVIWQ